MRRRARRRKPRRTRASTGALRVFATTSSAMLSAVIASAAAVATTPPSHDGSRYRATPTAAAMTRTSSAVVASRRRIRGVSTSSFFGGSHRHSAWPATAPASQAPATTPRMSSRSGSVSANAVAAATGTAATSTLRCSSHARVLPQASSRRHSYSSIWYMRAATSTMRAVSAVHAAHAAVTTTALTTLAHRGSPAQEHVDDAAEPVGLLRVREVAGALEDDQARVGDEAFHDARIAQRRLRVALAPDEQRRTRSAVASHGRMSALTRRTMVARSVPDAAR